MPYFAGPAIAHRQWLGKPGQGGVLRAECGPGPLLWTHIMKRFLLWGLAALALVAAIESSASAYLPPGIGCRNKRVGRLEGYWFQPTTGPLYDYSSYFAMMYPGLPGAQEYRWQPSQPGSAFGTAIAVLPYAPPSRPMANPNV